MNKIQALEKKNKALMATIKSLREQKRRWRYSAILRQVTFEPGQTLIVFDKDGTLVKPGGNRKFPATPKDQIPLWNFDWINPVKQNLHVAIATNQGGIEYGYKDEDFLVQEINYLLQELKFPANHVVACPDMAGKRLLIKDPEPITWSEKFFYIDESHHYDYLNLNHLKGTFRKPDPGMLLALEQIFAWENDESFFFSNKVFIGNDENDKKAAIAAGFKYLDIQQWLDINQFDWINL